MKAPKKNLSSLFSDYSFLSPFGWSIKNRYFPGIVFGLLVFLSPVIPFAILFYILSRAQLIDPSTLDRLISSQSVWPLLVLVMMALFRYLTYKKSGGAVMKKGLRLYYLRLWLGLKFLLLVVALPLIGRALAFLNIQVNDYISTETGLFSTTELIRYIISNL